MAPMDYRVTAALAFTVVAGTIAAGWHGTPASVNAASQARLQPHARQETGRAAAHSPTSPSPSPSQVPDVAAPQRPALSPTARRSCPPAASACVDLSDHLTWLQSGSRITYGPVLMESGPPGTSQATPRGTFHVQWKAGRSYISTEYHEPMPYAVFFASGGVAFHGGSLDTPSHGCVHLPVGSAEYYHDHLPVGAEVVVS
jgi:lipoprotein-anchoring transpeptidase ErfK/SrfK